MVSSAVSCPSCGKPDAVVKHGTNRNGTARCRCRACNKTFTPAPRPRRVTPETEEKILAALSERLSIEAVARLVRVSKTTVYNALKKSGDPRGGDRTAPTEPV